MLLTIVGTLLSFSKSEAWYIRILDFPRLQLFFIGFIGIITFSFPGINSLIEYAFIFSALASVLFQGSKIFPYTFLHKKQVKNSTKNKTGTGKSICVVICNVRMKNKNYSATLLVLKKADPDLILLVETNSWWEKHTRELEKNYPYSVKIPLENTYGMILYSRLKLIDPEINFLVEKDIPSIETIVELQSGDKVHFYGVHPRPPAPSKSGSSLPRDIELLLIAEETKKKTLPVIVAGDLNDVAWSYTTHLFQNTSGLFDPRVGRGMFSTYHAGVPMFRWPLDHLFHSNHFQLIEMKRLENIDSDHFPILISLHYEPGLKFSHSTPQPSSEEKKDARQKLRKAERSGNTMRSKNNTP